MRRSESTALVKDFPQSWTSGDELMKKISVLLAGLGLIAFAANANAVNLLLNPDLDNVAVGDQALATPISWHVTSSRSLTGPFTDGASPLKVLPTYFSQPAVAVAAAAVCSSRRSKVTIQ